MWLITCEAHVGSYLLALRACVEKHVKLELDTNSTREFRVIFCDFLFTAV